MATTEERRRQQIIARQCDVYALADELLKVSTVRKNQELQRRVVGIQRAARHANILCCIEFFSDELDPAA